MSERSKLFKGGKKQNTTSGIKNSESWADDSDEEIGELDPFFKEVNQDIEEDEENSNETEKSNDEVERDSREKETNSNYDNEKYSNDHINISTGENGYHSSKRSKDGRFDNYRNGNGYKKKRKNKRKKKKRNSPVRGNNGRKRFDDFARGKQNNEKEKFDSNKGEDMFKHLNESDFKTEILDEEKEMERIIEEKMRKSQEKKIEKKLETKRNEENETTENNEDKKPKENEEKKEEKIISYPKDEKENSLEKKQTDMGGKEMKQEKINMKYEYPFRSRKYLNIHKYATKEAVDKVRKLQKSQNVKNGE